MIFFKAAIYKKHTLQQVIESISIEDAEKLLVEGPAQGLRINVAAFLQDGRHLDGVYQAMGPSIYAQPFAVHTAPHMDAEEIAERIAQLQSIIPQYQANLAYAAK